MAATKGRTAGSKGYPQAELFQMFEVLMDEVPLGPDEWTKAYDAFIQRYPDNKRPANSASMKAV